MTALDTNRPLARPVASRSFVALARLAYRLAEWNNRRVTRQALVKLTDRELDDIGLSRADIARL